MLKLCENPDKIPHRNKAGLLRGVGWEAVLHSLMLPNHPSRWAASVRTAWQRTTACRLPPAPLPCLCQAAAQTLYHSIWPLQCCTDALARQPPLDHLHTFPRAHAMSYKGLLNMTVKYEHMCFILINMCQAPAILWGRYAKHPLFILQTGKLRHGRADWTCPGSHSR